MGLFDFIKGEEGFIPDFIPIYGTREKLENAIDIIIPERKDFSFALEAVTGAQIAPEEISIVEILKAPFFFTEKVLTGEPTTTGETGVLDITTDIVSGTGEVLQKAGEQIGDIGTEITKGLALPIVAIVGIALLAILILGQSKGVVKVASTAASKPKVG